MSIVLGKIISKTTVLATTVLLSTLSCYAADINLSEIEFSTANNGYNVVLKTDKNTSFKKNIQSDEKITIELKNTTTTEDFSTIYNDVSDINNITVTPIGRDDLKIQIQGSNISKSHIIVDASMDSPIAAQNFEPNQIDLSMPIENSKPVYSDNLLEEEDEESATITPLAKLGAAPLVQNLGKIAENTLPSQNQNFGWLTYLGLGIIMLTAAKNIFKSNKDTAIGLSQSLVSREKEIAQKLNTGVKETLSLRSKIAQNASAPSINYGLRSYQNSQKNPYDTVTTPIRPIRKSQSTATFTKPQLQQNSQVSNIATKTRNSAQNSNVTPLHSRSTSSNIDSMKFLESMTRIYEKNGRKDLAQGLKHNINKVNF